MAIRKILEFPDPRLRTKAAPVETVDRRIQTLVEDMFESKVSVKKSIFGHSMGGHGALTIFLKNPSAYVSVSAFSPICNPTEVPWGQKAFAGYLGSVEAGMAHDAVELVKGFSGKLSRPVLIDQGAADKFLVGEVNQLRPEAEALADAFCKAGLPLKLRMQEGYDHSYFFIASFVEEHINYHADALI